MWFYTTDNEYDEQAITQTENVSMSSSKDHILISRAALLLFIIDTVFRSLEPLASATSQKRRKTRTTRPAASVDEAASTIRVPAEVPQSFLIAAEKIMITARKQKMLFLEV